MERKLLQIMEEVNSIAKDRQFRNGKEWAKEAKDIGSISYSEYKRFIECHNARCMIGHPGALKIYVTRDIINNARDFLYCISHTNLRKYRKSPNMPYGGYRACPYVKEFHWKGVGGREYNFRYHIVKEYQKRAYDDGTRFEGYGYTIYVKQAPYKNWCLEHNRQIEFHFYSLPIDNPSICWNRLITNFEDANAIMYEWTIRYCKILDNLFLERKVDDKALNKATSQKGYMPDGTFRSGKQTKTIHISKSVYNEMLKVISKGKTELGGMLGWKDDQDYIDTFVFDYKAKVGECEYNPNVEYLMSVINGEWSKNDIYFGGFVHSHPRGCNMLSQADIEYSQKIMEAFELDYMFMPIITKGANNTILFNPYVVTIGGKVIRCKIDLFEDPVEEVEFSEEKLQEIRKVFDSMSKSKQANNEQSTLDQNSTFARISSVIDLEYMKDCTIVGIGCGGARGFYEDMARMGVGNFYFIDGDISSKSNIASQHGYISDIGKLKVDVVKNRLLDINDQCNIQSFGMMLDDKVSDEWLYNTIFKNHKKEKTLICAFTDDFFAQARAQEIAIKYSIPYLAAQHHEFGMTSEIIYWYPNVTKNSSKEILRNRYDSYANGFKNNVTSVGSPIYNTTRLNSLCAKIAMGELLYDKEIKEGGSYSSFIKYHSERNLILIRQKALSPLDSQLYDVFINDEMLYFDDVAWIDTNDFCN